MALDEVALVLLEHADRVRVGLADLVGMEAGVEERSIRRAVISSEELEGVRTEAVEGVEVSAGGQVSGISA